MKKCINKNLLGSDSGSGKYLISSLLCNNLKILSNNNLKISLILIAKAYFLYARAIFQIVANKLLKKASQESKD